MQNTSAQLLFPVRHDPLKLSRDPPKVVAGSPRDLLKILVLLWKGVGGGGGDCQFHPVLPLC